MPSSLETNDASTTATTTTTTTTATAADELTPLAGASSSLSSDAKDEMAKRDLILVLGSFIAVYVLLVFVLGHLVSVLLAFLFGILLSQTIPEESTFDVAKEMKRIKRGKHLPEGHRDKPKSWAEKKLRNVTTALTTGITSSVLQGYSVHFVSMGFVGKMAVVRDGTTGEVFYWAGILGSWRFELGQRMGRIATYLNSETALRRREQAGSLVV